MAGGPDEVSAVLSRRDPRPPSGFGGGAHARQARASKGREWAGLSPFTQEKTPSFFVNDQKGFYHDFSSQKHGDVFDFLMETEGLTFPEAVERLAAHGRAADAGRIAESAAREQKRATLHEVMALAAKFFEAALTTAAGAKARGYLADRGLDAATQREFGLGYAPPDRYRAARRARRQGRRRGRHDRDRPADPRRGHRRALRPVPRPRDVPDPATARGRVIAFGGRALDPSVKPKYLNSPETALFHKGALLFNHHRARKAAHDKGDGDRRRGLCRRDRHGQAGFPNGRAARHRADHRAMRAAVDDGRGADPVLRRRQGRAQGGVSGASIPRCR